MATDVLARIKPLATQLTEQLAQVQTLRQQARHAEAARAEAIAGELMVRGPLAAWMTSRFRRKGASHELAEDLAMEVWTKLIKGCYAGTLQVDSNALGLLSTMARHQLIDHWRRQRGTAFDAAVRADGDPAEDSGFDLDGIRQADAPDLELQDCVQRKLVEFSAASPSRGELLQWVADGLSRREIAAIVLKKPLDRVTANDEGAMRDRVYQARRQAQPYFDECKD